MAILYRYLKNYWQLVAVALVLAAINQVFSLLDPLIFRHIIDSYATRYREYSSPQFVKGVSVLLGAAIGVAFVSRIAKNFQDYFVNVITQKVGARIYTDASGTRSSCRTSSLKISVVAKRSVNCRKFARTLKSSSLWS
jgi:ATP-binding cassette, subfamily B, bacterial